MRREARRLEEAERHFRADIWRSIPIDAVAEDGVQTRGFGPILATVFGSLPRETKLNVIQGAAERGALEDGCLEEAIEWMGEWEADFVVPAPAGHPGSPALERWLAEHGYEQRDVVRKHVRRASPPAAEPRAPGVEILELEGGEGEGMDEIAAEGLELPTTASFLFQGLPYLEGWRCYVALLDGRLAACGSMLIDGGVATIGLDGARRRARRRGCNALLLDRRLRDAAAAGCHTIFAESCDTPSGHAPLAGNLARAGFSEAYRSVNWASPPRR